MSDTNLFLLASRHRWRFESNRGQLTVEDLWELPLKTATSASDLNSIAIGLNDQLKGLAEESFVESDASSPERELLTNQLELIKQIIAIRKADMKAAQDRFALDSRKARLRELIQAKKDEELAAGSVEDLEAQLAALGG